MIFKKRSLTYFSLLIVAVFILTSRYDYSLSRQNLENAGPSATPQINVSAPALVNPGEPIEVTWQINTPTPRLITSTTIYYDVISTPSAVTSADSPAALGYANSLPDYQQGDFESPAEFNAIIPPLTAPTIYLRGYALIDKSHYWTDELKILIK